MCKVSVIITTKNRRKLLAEALQSVLEQTFRDFECIVVDDASTDDTRNILEKNCIPHINLIHNLGIGGAVQTGYKYAKINNYDIAIQFDGDGQHDVSYVKHLVEPIVNKKANMVIGSRFLDNTSEFKSTKARRIGIRLISWVINFKTKVRINDVTSGFRAIDKNIINLFCSDYPTEYPEPISTVKVVNHNYKVKEVPVKMKERQNGKSSITSWKSAYYMFNVIISILVMGRRIK